MKIYTGRGDEGDTDLRDMTRVSKASPRIEAYGTVDELNALLGMVQPTGYDDIDANLGSVQNHLHVIQADFANPDPEADDPVVTGDHVERVEAWIDEAQGEVSPQEQFIIPGGSEAGAGLHHARTVCRRAERRAIALAEAEPVNETALVYLNRLSDALFVFARLANQRDDVEESEPTY